MANAQAGANYPQAGLDWSQNLIKEGGITPGLQNVLNQYGNLYTSNLGSGGNADQGGIGTFNPWLQQVLNSTVGNKIQSSMSGAGRYGSGSYDQALAAGYAPALAQDWQNRMQNLMGISGAQAGIYQTGNQQAGQAAQLTPMLMQAQYMPGQVEEQVGAERQAQNQRQIDAAMQAFYEPGLRQQEALGLGASILPQLGGLGYNSSANIGTNVQNWQSPAPTGQRVLGGALAGAGMGSAFGPLGSLGGAGLGAGLGYFL